MKKIITLMSAAILLLAGTSAFAQPAINAGYLNSIDLVKSGNSTNTSPMSGFYAGVSFTVPVVSGLNFTPGIYYGYAAKSNSTDLIITTVSGKREDHFINIPLHFSYGLEFNPDFVFFAYAGPSASIGVASKITGALGGNKGSYDRYQENSNLNRFDIMLGGGVGVEIMEKFRINVGYDFGMLSRYKNNDTAYRRNQLTAGVAFLF